MNVFSLQKLRERSIFVTEAIILLLYNLFLTAIFAIAGICAYYFYVQKNKKALEKISLSL